MFAACSARMLIYPIYILLILYLHTYRPVLVTHLRDVDCRLWFPSIWYSAADLGPEKVSTRNHGFVRSSELVPLDIATYYSATSCHLAVTGSVYSIRSMSSSSPTAPSQPLLLRYSMNCASSSTRSTPVISCTKKYVIRIPRTQQIAAIMNVHLNSTSVAHLLFFRCHSTYQIAPLSQVILDESEHLCPNDGSGLAECC